MYVCVYTHTHKVTYKMFPAKDADKEENCGDKPGQHYHHHHLDQADLHYIEENGHHYHHQST